MKLISEEEEQNVKPIFLSGISMHRNTVKHEKRQMFLCDLTKVHESMISYEMSYISRSKFTVSVQL